MTHLRAALRRPWRDIFQMSLAFAEAGGPFVSFGVGFCGKTAAEHGRSADIQSIPQINGENVANSRGGCSRQSLRQPF